MDKFSEILKSTVESYQAPLNPQVWENISSQLGNSLDPFEQSIKDSVDKFQAPAANAAVWSAISSQLGPTLSPFEQSMKESVDKFQAPAANPMVWENISSQLGNSQFEQSVKESIEGYEAPYSASAWEAVKDAIGSSSTWKWVVGSAAALVLLLGGGYYLSDDDGNTTSDENNTIENTQVAENNDINTNNNVIVEDNDNDQGTSDSDNNNAFENDEEDILHHIDPDNNNNVAVIHENNGPDFTNGGNNNGESNGTEGNEGNSGETNSGNGGEQNANATATINETKVYTAEFTCDEAACQGSKMIFVADQAERGVEYVWNFGDGSSANGTSVDHIYTTDGDYEVSLVVYKEGESVAAAGKEIVVHRIPIPSFTVDQPNSAIPSYEFNNESEVGTTVSWEIDGMGKTSRESFEMTFREKGSYVARLTATNEFGCSNSRKQIIEVDNDFNLLAPNAVLINDIDERRATFMPAAIPILNTEFVMTIYGKDGGMVYQTQDANKPWDGRNREGQFVTAGAAYVWIVQLKNANGEMETYKGTVTVVK